MKELIPYNEEAKNVNVRVAFLDSLPIHLKLFVLVDASLFGEITGY